MNKTTTVAVVLALSAGAASAGGFDRSGQGIGIIFEKGNYAEYSMGYVMPDVRATAAPTGDVAPDYFTFSGGVKQDLSDKLSVALIVDQPFGAAVQYPAALGNGYAYLESTGISAIARYKLDGGFSVHGGLRYVVMDGRVNIGTLPVGFRTQDFSADGALGYLVGAAYERPDIALRVALTYFSETKHELTSSVGGAGTINPPQAVNLDFQTGVAANTLVFGQVRWADWSNTAVRVPAAPGVLAPILTYTQDSWTYSLGVGRKFNDNWSGAVSFGYEAAQGGVASRLAPVDGKKSITVGATYTRDNMKITGGVSYIKLGDANTGAPLGAFSNNEAIGLGLRVGFNF